MTASTARPTGQITPTVEPLNELRFLLLSMCLESDCDPAVVDFTVEMHKAMARLEVDRGAL
jgi:hypothetical protein